VACVAPSRSLSSPLLSPAAAAAFFFLSRRAEMGRDDEAGPVVRGAGRSLGSGRARVVDRATRRIVEETPLERVHRASTSSNFSCAGLRLGP
jgi:hypothetical protein